MGSNPIKLHAVLMEIAPEGPSYPMRDVLEISVDETTTVEEAYDKFISGIPFFAPWLGQLYKPFDKHKLVTKENADLVDQLKCTMERFKNVATNFCIPLTADQPILEYMHTPSPSVETSSPSVETSPLRRSKRKNPKGAGTKSGKQSTKSTHVIRQTATANYTTLVIVYTTAKVVPAPPPTPPPSASTKPSVSLIERARLRFEAILCHTPQHSPSIAASSSKYKRSQMIEQGLDLLSNGRQGYKALPVEAYHPAFALYKCIADDDNFLPPGDFVDKVRQFMAEAQSFSGKERERQVITRKHLNCLLDLSLIDGHADHWDRATCQITTDTAMLVLIEEKTEAGTGNDGTVQASYGYVNYWRTNPLVRASNCPSFVVCVAGATLTISAAILTAYPDIYTLSQGMLLSDSSTANKQLYMVARHVYALREAMKTLRVYYSTLSNDVRDKYARFFPTVTEYLPEGSTHPIKFRYKNYLKDPYNACPVFLVEEMSGREVVVKFVTTYSVEAHKTLEDAGYAPKLLYYGPVWREHTCPQTYSPPNMHINRVVEKCPAAATKMVVMEYVKGKPACDVKSTNSTKMLEVLRTSVGNALSVLHAKGLVHGDIRPPNIMIVMHEDEEVGDLESLDDMSNRVRIIDFDWAGPASQAYYPVALSSAVQWPKGACFLESITQAHDLEMVFKL